jgi:NhaP-type Na+/H+ or K+/H+ antiporter
LRTTFDSPSEAAALARTRKEQAENSIMVLIGYFIIAAIAGIAVSAIIGFVLTNLMIRCFTKADRPIKIS